MTTSGFKKVAIKVIALGLMTMCFLGLYWLADPAYELVQRSDSKLLYWAVQVSFWAAIGFIPAYTVSKIRKM